jgi:ATP-dependent Lon protease
LENTDEANLNGDEIPGGFSKSGDYEVPAIMSNELVLFPGMEIITVVKERRNLSALNEALNKHQILALIPSSKLEARAIGTLAIVRHSESEPTGDGRNLELKGMWRIRIKKLVESSGHSRVLFERVDEPALTDSSNGASLVRKVQGQIDEFVKLIPGIPSDIVNLLRHTDSPGNLADLCANSPEFTHEERVELLETIDQEERLGKVSILFDRQLNALRKLAKVEPISECEKCLELADKAFDSDPSLRAEIAVSFLNHIVREHTGELLALLAEKYLPIFMNKRSMR